MLLISEEDRHYIGNKYHAADDPAFSPFRRFTTPGYTYDESTGLSDEAIKKGLRALAEETASLPHALAQAKAFTYVLDNTRIDVNPHDYFVGIYGWVRLSEEYFFRRWHREVFDAMPDISEMMSDYYAAGIADMWLDTDHSVPDWKDILRLGFRGLANRAAGYRKQYEVENALTEKERAFFDAIELEYTAICRVIGRFRDYALAHPNEKTPLIAESLTRIEKEPPQTFFDALQVMYFYFMCSESFDMFQVRSLGSGLDRTLYPYYRHDIDAGLFTEQELASFLAYFFLQFSSIGNYFGQPFYLCGTADDETTPVTPLTLLILDTYDRLSIYNPKIQLKIDENTPQMILDAALDMIRRGHTSLVICCMPGIIRSLMSGYGVSYDEASACDISGCNEMHIRANEACMISALPNMAKAITFVFHNGIDPVSGKMFGIETGPLSAFPDFDSFYAAFIAQFSHILDTLIGAACRYEPRVSEIKPSVMYSGTIERSLIQKKDAYAFGVKYRTSAILLCSFATAVDSLMAIKELVYDEKVVTLDEYKKALDANYEGYEALRLKALRARHKYGCGDEDADRYAAAIFSWFSIYVTGKKNGRGGVYKVGVPSTLHFIDQGRVCEATPDGRRHGEEFSKNVAPVIGMERKGVTGMIGSALNLSPFLFSEAFVLDVMLHPSAVKGDEGLGVMRSLVLDYMRLGGLCIQFNIFSTSLLRDAQAHPERYKNLQVRVSGWNVLWNNLSREEQEAYILRAENLEKG